jgi:REP element-mobilizing transposase RayT
MMARQLRINYPGAFYHVTSRGNERKAVFKSTRDREKFLEYLETATLRYNAAVHVYCLMENHYHLLLETPLGNLPQIMRHINGAYTTYFNVKRDRSGHLFQGRYKAILIDANEYAKELSRYIHLNPVRAEMVERPEEYNWSSYQDYTGVRKAHEWLNREFILGNFGSKFPEAERAYKKFVSSLEGKECESPLKEVFASTILGGTGFVEYVKKSFVKDKEVNKQIPATKVLMEKASMEEILECVDREFPVSRLSRDLKQYLSHRYTSERLEKIGDQFKISESAVSHAVKRISKNIAEDKKLRKKVDNLIRKFKLSRFKT